MKLITCLFLMVTSLNVFAVTTWTGPAGAECKTMNGDVGKQSWTTHNGRGYWTCCLAGTSCNRNPKSEFVVSPIIQSKPKVGP